MKKTTQRGRAIRAFLVQGIPNHPRDIVSVTCRKFGISRQAVNRYVRELVDTGQITAQGNTSQRQYSLNVLLRERFSVPLAELQEDRVWRTRVEGTLKDLPQNVLGVWQYAFTEMVNNAIDHSDGTTLTVLIEMNAFQTEMLIRDDGIGIFRKIKEECHLEDERHAVLELAKGKLTTDPERHTGEGIFFTSRMLDDFAVLSGDVYFSHTFGEEEDWISQREKPDTGTAVFMYLANKSTRTTKEVFDHFASEEEDYGFNKTVVPVRLARHGAEQLVSRSQAKRLLARIDRFNIVIFDFARIDAIGQAFADEIFRVFERSHPHIRLLNINTSAAVEQMISRAQTRLNGEQT
jgi:anti-sigma regulatory factor (Ser/Thr protein kinase)